MLERKAVDSCGTVGNCPHGRYSSPVSYQSVTTRRSCHGLCTNTLTEVSGRVTAVFDRPMPPKSRLIFVLPTRTHSDCISELLKDTAQERCWPSRTEQRRQALLCHLSYTPLFRLTLYGPPVTIRTTNLTYVPPTQCIYVFRVDMRKKTAIISLYSID